jgi:hypothetical protein
MLNDPHNVALSFFGMMGLAVLFLLWLAWREFGD